MEITNRPLALDEKRGLLFAGFNPAEVINPKLLTRVTKILTRLLTKADLSAINGINLNILRQKRSNAASHVDPNGDASIVVTTGSLTLKKKDGTLANALGHELGHIKYGNHDDPEGQAVADHYGSELAYKAGYSKQAIIDDYHTLPENEQARAHLMIEFVKSL